MRTQGEALDTLTFLMLILGAIVECAKVVAVIVAFVLLFGFCKYLPLKLHKYLPRIVGAAFILTLATVDCEQLCICLSLCWNRLGGIVLALYGSVTMMLILFTIVLVTAILERDGESYSFRTFFGTLRGKDGLRKFREVNVSNSYLAMTPVLLS